MTVTPIFVDLDPKIILACWREDGLPAAVPEYRFHPDRKWRFDFAFVKKRVAVEVQGGIWIHGRHTRGAALKKEWEKLNTAAGMGWRILYCEPNDIFEPGFIELLKTALKFTPDSRPAISG